jgi:surfeit locus 1 family protein
MKRLPVIPTLLVAVAVAAMIGLGVWQLRRAEWKQRLVSELAAARDLPALNLDPMATTWSPGQSRATNPPIAFRRAGITCYAPSTGQPAPAVRAGRNRRGETGYSYLLPCFWDDQYHWTDRLRINVGWSDNPRLKLLTRPIQFRVEGVVGAVEPGEEIVLVAERSLPPLEPSAPPRVENIPNNHLSYALQWFFFAGAAAVIYLLALRRRSR